MKSSVPGAPLSFAAEITELYRVYRDVKLLDVAILWSRRMKLYSASLSTAKRPTGMASNRRLVISLSTIPSRIQRIKPVLKSLLDQDTPADAVMLAVPRFSRREQRTYSIPRYLENSQAIQLLACDDWGPATKLIPALAAVNDPDTLLLIVDDDVIYPPDFVSTFLRWHERYPDAALGYRGWTMPESLRWAETETRYATSEKCPFEVDVVTGAWGVLVQPRFFDDQLLDYGHATPEAFYVDDIWINGHLARRGIPRLLIPARLPPMSTVISRTNGLIFRENRNGHNNDVVIRHFSQYWRRNRKLADAAV